MSNTELAALVVMYVFNVVTFCAVILLEDKLDRTRRTLQREIDSGRRATEALQRDLEATAARNRYR